MDKKLVLVADDDAAIRTVLNQALMRAGFEVRITSNVSTLWKWISEGQGDVVVSDVIMPDGDAFELLPRIRKLRPDLPVILISAQNTLMTAVKAQKAGAYEYLPKPFDLDDLTRAVQRAVSSFTEETKHPVSTDNGQELPLVGRSPAMQDIYQALARLMNSDLPVMLSGPSGSGKRLVARVLHDLSRRKNGLFLSVNLAAVPKEEIEGRIFGNPAEHSYREPGLLQRADRGTLYIQEINELPESAQSRLLQLLVDHEMEALASTDSHHPDVRIICSLKGEIGPLIQSGKFREDLFHRLNVVPLRLPALSDRREDISDLARHFVKLNEKQGNPFKHLDASAISVLKNYAWPGNVRELENLVNRICTLYPQETITDAIAESELGKGRIAHQPERKEPGHAFADLEEATRFFINRFLESHDGGELPENIYPGFLEKFEKPVIISALSATNGNQIKAAQLLGLNRNTLRKKISSYNIRIIKTAR